MTREAGEGDLTLLARLGEGEAGRAGEELDEGRRAGEETGEGLSCRTGPLKMCSFSSRFFALST